MIFRSKYLAKLAENIRVKEILLGNRDEPLDAKLSSTGHLVSTSFLPKDDVFELTFDPNRSNPEDTEYIQSILMKGKIEGFKLKFRVGYGKRVENSALLLVAYLFLFYRLGYFLSSLSLGFILEVSSLVKLTIHHY